MAKYILKNRNKANNIFRIVNEDNREKTEIVSELSMIERVKDDEHQYYTLNKTDNSLTEVIIVDGQLRSVPNDTKEDNIANLPRI